MPAPTEALEPARADPGSAHFLVALQRAAGNRAVASLVAYGPPTLQRDHEPEGNPGSRPNLDVGDTGPGVRLLQLKLTQRGYRVAATGRFDAATHTAAVRFQQDRPKLHPATGGVGPLTWQALDGPPDPLQLGDTMKIEGVTYVVYPDEVRSGGTVSWACRNPGNIRIGERFGSYSGKRFHTAKVGDFSIFPDETTGFMAIIAVLQSYGHVTIGQAMKKYAPVGDASNDPEVYARAAARELHLSVNTLVDGLADEQFAIFATLIQRVEGWHPGTTHGRSDPSLPEKLRQRLSPATG